MQGVRRGGIRAVIMPDEWSIRCATGPRIVIRQYGGTPIVTDDIICYRVPHYFLIDTPFGIGAWRG